MRIISGQLQGEWTHVGIIVARFNETITKNLLEGALDCLLRHGVEEEHITTVWVPGAFEIPLAAKTLAISNQFDVIICLGAIIRGQTPHFEYVAAQTAAGVSAVSLESYTPIIFGVLTTDTIEQAMERSGCKSGNKGFEAAMAALEMNDVITKIGDEFYEFEEGTDLEANQETEEDDSNQ
jgi:6,7-dimethyl-8-ribityllumazine synthase